MLKRMKILKIIFFSRFPRSTVGIHKPSQAKPSQSQAPQPNPRGRRRRRRRRQRRRRQFFLAVRAPLAHAAATISRSGHNPPHSDIYIYIILELTRSSRMIQVCWAGRHRDRVCKLWSPCILKYVGRIAIGIRSASCGPHVFRSMLYRYTSRSRGPGLTVVSAR